jgi:hypothetical protein
VLAVSIAAGGSLARPQPARASASGLCGILGSIGPGWLGKACGVVTDPGKAVGIVKKVLSGKPGQALKLLLGGGGRSALSRGVGIAAIVAWAVGGAHFVLSETAKLVGETTSPELTAAWFSSVYWRVAAVGALLTLPFLVAAAIQALLRTDGPLLARAVFGYLPISFIATGAAAPVAMILLHVTDWMGSSVASAAGDQGSHFLVESGVAIGALGVLAGSPFVAFLVALLTAAAGLVLWLELLVRAAAVYVVVLMLPLIFSAMVWPARRVWAVRAVEILVALILAKFAIVSVLALAAAALGHGGGSLIVRALAGLVLVTLGGFAPWVLLRLLPLAEIASAATGHVREHAQARLSSDAALASHGASKVGDNVASLIARMQRFESDGTHRRTQALGADRANSHNSQPPVDGQSPDRDRSEPGSATAAPSGASRARSGAREVVVDNVARSADSEPAQGVATVVDMHPPPQADGSPPAPPAPPGRASRTSGTPPATDSPEPPLTTTPGDAPSSDHESPTKLPPTQPDDEEGQ